MAKFTKGKSGNPQGRPKSESAALRKALADRGADVAGVVLAAALGGDLVACRMVLERLVPPLKATAAPVALVLPVGVGLTDTGKAILSAAADGELPPDIASQLLTALGTLSKIIEIDELERRLSKLEGEINHDLNL